MSIQNTTLESILAHNFSVIHSDRTGSHRPRPLLLSTILHQWFCQMRSPPFSSWQTEGEIRFLYYQASAWQRFLAIIIKVCSIQRLTWLDSEVEAIVKQPGCSQHTSTHRIVHSTQHDVICPDYYWHCSRSVVNWPVYKHRLWIMIQRTCTEVHGMTQCVRRCTERAN